MVILKTGRRRKSKGSVKSERQEAPKASPSFVLTVDMPPSVNKLYIKRMGGGLALSKVANRFREGVKKKISKRMAELSVFPSEDHEIPYTVEITAYFQSLENPGWFERFAVDSFYAKDSKDGKHKKGELKHKKGDRKAKTRYKKVDIDNRIKFVQDCVIAGLGIPGDEQVFEGTQRKVHTKVLERMEVIVTVADRARFFSWG